MTIEQSCFYENFLVGTSVKHKDLSATVILLGEDTPKSISESNYVTRRSDATSGEKCAFVGQTEVNGNLTCVVEATNGACMSTMEVVDLDWLSG